MSLKGNFISQVDPTYIPRMAGFELDPWQEDFYCDLHRKILIVASRQVGKTTQAAGKAYSLSKLLKGLGIIIAPSERQAKNVIRKIKHFWRADPDAPKLKGRESSLEMEFEDGTRIVARPANADTIRGDSAPDWILIDEAGYVPDEVYKGAVRPMLITRPDATLILLSTPFGKRGFFYETYKRNDPSWEIYEIPATKCPRISQEMLDEELEDLGQKFFDQEYGCKFLNLQESMFSDDLIANIFSDEIKEMEFQQQIEVKTAAGLEEELPWIEDYLS